jgi:hypothetical protein
MPVLVALFDNTAFRFRRDRCAVHRLELMSWYVTRSSLPIADFFLLRFINSRYGQTLQVSGVQVRAYVISCASTISLVSGASSMGYF